MDKTTLPQLKPCDKRLDLGGNRIGCSHYRVKSYLPDREVSPGACLVCSLDPNEEGSVVFYPSEGLKGPLKPPSLLAKAANYAKALARHKAGGSKIVPDEIKAFRRSICDPCEYRDKEKDECLVCGCVLHNTILGDKLAWASEACPKGKWPSWQEPEPLVLPPVEAPFPGSEPKLLALALTVEGQEPFQVNLPRLHGGAVQIWGGQGVAPIWGHADPCNGLPGRWYSPFDWSATVSRLAADGPNRRFVLSLERHTSTQLYRLIGYKLTALSMSPFLAVGQGIFMCGEDMAGACTPCKALLLKGWSVTITEAKA